jgi:protein ImuB
MLWLGLHFPLLALESFAQPEDSQQAVVVIQHYKQTKQVFCCNQAALAAGIKLGHTLSTALTLTQQLIVRKRSIDAERQMLDSVAVWAYQYSDAIVVMPPATVLVEVEASLKLFKNIESLLQHMQQHWCELNLTVDTSLGLTPLVATYLPQYYGVSFQRLRQLIQQTPLDVLKADIQRFSQKLPIDILPVKETVKSELSLLGLYTLEHIAALPSADFSQRFTPELTQWLERLWGKKPDPRRYFEVPKTFKHQLDIAAQVNHTQQLLFPIKRQLGLLKNYLIQRQLVCRDVRLSLDQRPQGIPTPIEIDVHMSQATANTEQFIELIRLKLAQVQLEDMVLSVTLSVEQFESPRQPAQDLLDDHAGGESFEHVLDRISAKLGAQTLKQLLPNADHRPEYSYRSSAYLSLAQSTKQNTKQNTQNSSHQSSKKSTAQKSHLQWQPLNPRPNWLLPHPEPLNALGHNPCYQDGPLTLHSEAERIDTGWWDGAPCYRDYYIAQSQAGCWLWIYYERSQKQWFVHGFFC